ncbi:MAG TPA: SDR family NAD(P)-dependent oxidoreductase, partial [Gemmatimonadaceae bacterium]|nr:SDR family NAD(P)-dependent oxidoreductase [Gemmatimonadaceae bacterium]
TPEPAAAAPETAVVRRVPIPVVRPALACCKPTGATLGPDAHVLVMADRRGVAQALDALLVERGVHVTVIGDAPDAESLRRCLAHVRTLPTGVFWLPALDDEGDERAMTIDGWREALRVRVKLLHETMRILDASVGGAGSFLVAATALGGAHGYGEHAATAPLGGAVAGYVKAYGRERPDALVKAVDFAAARDAEEIAQLLLAEVERDPGAVEVGYDGDLRLGVGLDVQALSDAPAGIALGADSVVVVTGAAGSIVSAIVGDLAAAAGGGTFHLLDLAPAPEASDPDVERCVSDREALKRDLATRLKANGKRATPAVIERELARLERARAALDTIGAVERAGGRAIWHQADLRDAAAVRDALATLRDGPVDLVLHGAGLEISRLVPDKSMEEFERVLDVKCDGWFNVLHALGDAPIAATVAFSSVAGRFGNVGQTDYSAANDLLCKLASAARATRPAMHALAIDWTAWAEIGMAARGSVPKAMAAAGIDMLPPSLGIPVVRRELASGSAGEVVVGLRLGALLAERDADGGIDVDALPPAPMRGRVVGVSLDGAVTVETTLDPSAQPFLDDHRIDGTPVLPGVMGIEAFGEAATCLLPGWRIAAVENVQFLAPFKFHRDEPRTVTVRAALRPAGDEVLAHCELSGVRALPRGEERTTHFVATVRLGRVPSPVLAVELPSDGGEPIVAADIYRVFFHGDAYRVLDRVSLNGPTVAGAMRVPLPAAHRPAEQPLVMAPRLVELCFQTAGVHEMETAERMGLPSRVDRVRVLDPLSGDAGPYVALVSPTADGAYDAVVADGAGRVLAQIEGYRTVALPSPVPAGALHGSRELAHSSSSDQ